MRWVNGVIEAPIDVDDDLAATFDSFGYEWTTFDEIQPEDERYWRDYYFVDVPPDKLRGANALDAGCGKGRFSRFTAQEVESLVALDGSDAVLAAARNLADLDNVAVVRADLLNLPFEDESFAFISCLGVLHHLPNPRVGLASLVRVLRPGGTLFLYVYSRDEGSGLRQRALGVATAMRRFTTRTPRRLLRILAAPLAVALYIGIVLPGAVGARFGMERAQRLPLAVYRGRPLRSLWLDTFDRLSAPIEHRFVWSEIEPWFEDLGIQVRSVRESAGLFIRAERPVVST